MAIDLKQLQCFIAVAEEASFSRAAARLHMTQPPLSTRIKQLEEDIGVELLRRSTRSVRLTRAGEALLADARQLLMQLEQAVDTARRVGRGAVGRLGIGFVPSAANSALPLLLRVFRQRYPGVSISLGEMSPAEQVRRLHSGRIDAGFFYLPAGDVAPFGDPDLRSQPVVREPLVVVLPQGHPLTATRRIDLSALQDQPFVLVAAHRGSGLRDIILQRCRSAGFTPRVVQEAALIETIGGLVASGVGIAIVPASLRRLQIVGVDYRPLGEPVPDVEMGLIWHRDSESPILRSFIEVSRAQLPAS